MCWKADFIDNRETRGYELDAWRNKRLQAAARFGINALFDGLAAVNLTHMS